MSENKLRIFGPLYLFIFLLIFFYGMFIKDILTAVVGISISAFYAILAWETNFWVIYFARNRKPGISNTKQRLLLNLATGLPVILLVSLVDHWFTYQIGLYKSFKWYDYVFIAGLNIMCSLIITGIYEGFYYVKNWRAVKQEAEEIKRINLTNQFQLLKEQVKPHFLFNSLNTLISLISSEPQLAIKFTQELSSVYRYLLRKNLSELSTVKEELEFINLYVSMMQTRFGDAFTVIMEINENDMDRMLPPFVLQLLVENAIKHNVVTRSKPLVICIESFGENIIVSNNLQKRKQEEYSEKTGLLNLIERYRLLKKDHLLEISEGDNKFSVSLPLLGIPQNILTE